MVKRVSNHVNEHVAKRFNKVIAVALSIATLTSATWVTVPRATAENAVPDPKGWQFASLDDFESMEIGKSYANWGKYCANVTDEAKADIGVGNSKGLYVHTTAEATEDKYCQPYYYMNKTANYSGATELWIWADFSKYQSPANLCIRPGIKVGSSEPSLNLIGGKPIYFQSGDSFRASTLTDTESATIEASIRKEDITGFKGYIRIPLSSFCLDGSGTSFDGNNVAYFKGAYFIYDYTFVTENEEYVENGFVLDNFMFVGPSIADGKPVSDLFGGGISEADKAAAQAVTDKINALPADITLAKKDDVTAARTAYNALSSDKVKALVTNYTKLLDAEKRIQELENESKITDDMKKAAAAAVDAINAIPAPDALTINDKAKVEAARKAYDAVNEIAKSLVTNYRTLTKAEARMVEVEAAEKASMADKVAAQAVSDMITALPASIRPTDQAILQAVRKAYDTLTEAQKKLVLNYSKLENSEKQMSAFTNRTPEDPDPMWNYLTLADFENLSNGYKFVSEPDTTSTFKNVYKYMNEPVGKNNTAFESVVSTKGFKGSKALTVQAVDDKGGYAQPLIRCDKLNGDVHKDFSGAEEMVLYVDFSNIKFDNAGFQFRFIENDCDASGNVTGNQTQWSLKPEAFVYIQDANGKWVKAYNNKDGYDKSENRLPASVVGRVKIPQDTKHPKELPEIAGYKGMVRIPLSMFTVIDKSPDANNKMDLRQIASVWTVFNYPDKQASSYFVIDQIGFDGNFKKTGQGETSILDYLTMSGSAGISSDGGGKQGGARTGEATAACGIFFALAAGSLTVCVRTRKSRKHQ